MGYTDDLTATGYVSEARRAFPKLKELEATLELAAREAKDALDAGTSGVRQEERSGEEPDRETIETLRKS